MTKYDLVTAAYGIQYGKPILYVWGRNENGKELFILRNEKPHCYIPADEIYRAAKYPYIKVGEKTKDIFGNVVVEIFTNIPKQVGELRRREIFSRTWEADIRFPLAMLIKRGIYGSFEITDDGKMIPCEPLFVPLKVAVIDLEVLSPPEIFPGPEEAEYPINSFALWNTFEKAWHVFVFVEGERDRKESTIDENNEVVHYHIYASEFGLLWGVILYLEREEFDIITGWNSNSFDMLTFYNRSLKNNLDIAKISPIGAVYKRSAFTSKTYMKARSEVFVSGVILFDGLTAYKKVMVARGELESYSLAFVSEFELGEERIKERQFDLVKTADPIRIGNYPKRDAYWTRRILEKRRVITYFDHIRKVTGCRYEDATINSRLLDSYCLHKARDKGFVLPSKMKIPKDYKYKGKEAKYEGATVREPIVGRHRNVGVIDFSSHYPNAMIGCNMSPETIVTWRDIKVSTTRVTTVPKGMEDRFVPTEDRPYTEIGNGVAFYNDVQGFVPELLEELKIERAKYTDQMDIIALEKGTTCDEWDVLYWLQFAVKFINTAFYGVFAYPGFRLYVLEISDCTTFIGRDAMQFTILFVELTLPDITLFEHIVLYGDTDSLFLTLEEADPDYLDHITQIINTQLIDLAVKHNMVEGFQIKPERVFISFILKDAKKKYFGEMLWKDGAFIDVDDPKRFQVKGFAAKRSDSSRFTRRVQKETLIMIAEFKSKKEIIEYLEGAIEEIKAIYEHIDAEKLLEFGVPKGFSSESKLLKRNDPWARGARYAYIHYDKLILQHYKPKLLYVHYPGEMREGMWWSETEEVSFDVPEKLPRFLLAYIDVNTTIEKCIQKKVEPLLELVKIDWGELGHGQTALSRWT